MTKTNIITTPSGDKMIVIPLDEYKALTTPGDADVATYDAIKARIARGEEEIFPAEVVNRIIDGENKIRVIREHRGKSVKQLAQDAGIAAPYLSQIERGVRDGTIDTYRKIAAALNVSLDMIG